MKLIQFSDIHLTTEPEVIYGRDPNVNFPLGLKHCMQFHSDAAGFFISGDLTEHGEVENYEKLEKHLASLDMPVGLTLGNHDVRENFAKVFPDRIDDCGFAQAVVPLPKGAAIMIDTLTTGSHYGSLCEKRARWLENALKQNKGPLFLFMHHHPLPTHLPRMDTHMFRDGKRFAEVLTPHKQKIAHIFFGHIHIPMAGSFCGIPASSTRGPNQNGWPNHADGKVDRGSDVLQAYTVIFADDPSITVQMVEFGLEI